MKLRNVSRIWMVATLLVVALVSPASAAGRQIVTDGNDSDSSLDLSRVVFRYTGGNVVVKMSTHEAWRVRDIASVSRAGDRNFYIDLDTSGDFRMDYYLGIYRDNHHLYGIVRENDGARIGDRVARIAAKRVGRRVEFKVRGSVVGVGGSRIHWQARTHDRRTCNRGCFDYSPNRRWSVYRY